MHLMRNRIIPKLDFLLWFYWDVHVFLCPLADLCVWDPALWPVSHTLSHVNENAAALLPVYEHQAYNFPSQD